MIKLTMNWLSLFWRRAWGPIDRFLDRFTSYKIVLYILYTYIGWAVIGGLFNKVPYHWYAIILAALWLIALCRVSNIALARVFDIPKNRESDLITALILCLILAPASSLNDALILAAAAIVAMVSKYVLVISRWHIFNPAALGAFISGALFHHYASWWVGSQFITPIVVLGAVLILRKMQRFSLAAGFLLIALIVMSWGSLSGHSPSASFHHVWLILYSTQIIFFASVMLLEPLTSPRQNTNYMLYGGLVAFLYSIARLKVSPEQALLLGNVFAYLIEPQSRQKLAFVKKVAEADGIQSFIFSRNKKLKYQAGQYMEWTIADKKADFRGNRRYLTLSSSPTENELMFSVRMPTPASSFKQRLAGLKGGEDILAAQVSGEFTLPKSQKQKLAFIAGGIGVTPFRSMAKYLIDCRQRRPIIMLYSANTSGEFAFTKLFKEAENHGLRTLYYTGRLDKHIIKKAFPDSSERTFYISGPYGFVRSVKDALLTMGVPSKKIVSDYFPGYG